MAATQVGLVYSTRQKIVRRVIVPDSDAALDLPGWIGAGETLIRMPLQTYQAMGSPADRDAWLASQIGPPVGTDRVVILDGRNDVVAITRADALLAADVAGLNLPKGYSLLETNTPCELGQRYNASAGTFS